MKRSVLIILALFLLLVLPTALTGLRTAALREPSDFLEMLEMDEISRDDVLAERYWRMVDTNGREIMVTGRRIYVGDEYITGDNKLYRVYKVSGRTAYARYIREVGAVFDAGRTGIFAALAEKVLPVQNNEEEGNDLAPETEPQRLIGIYHTHNAESYVPSEGTDSIFGKGGIHQVGASFKDAMEEKGIRVIHDETLHLPHDRGAYRRSRPTAERLLKEGPDIIFDIHRDAVPRHVYATQIEDEWVTQVQFVVGRQNPNMAVNRQLALDMKSTADEIHPGLVRGIFMARGHYNQDLTPMNLLLEVGAHTNSREAAEGGIALFTDVVAFYFYGPEEERERAAPFQAQRPPGARTSPGNRAAARNIMMLLGVTAAIIIGFVLLNTGHLSDLKDVFAPFLSSIRRTLKQGDQYLLPWREKIYKRSGPVRRYLEPVLDKIDVLAARAYETAVPWLEKGDNFLLPWQERIHEFSLRAYRGALPVLERADSFLEPWQEKIHVSAAAAWSYLFPRLRAADRYLSSTQERMYRSTRRVWDNLLPWLLQRDEQLALWQKKIRDYALMLKERIINAYNRFGRRRKIR
ncbi:MAG: stage II sporulation protein P [Dethiobacter sp.]|jgi:stage II sporulation protein P|nr:stage II sporulation protein P [Dethiobacter sp.]